SAEVIPDATRRQQNIIVNKEDNLPARFTKARVAGGGRSCVVLSNTAKRDTLRNDPRIDYRLCGHRRTIINNNDFNLADAFQVAAEDCVQSRCERISPVIAWNDDRYLHL